MEESSTKCELAIPPKPTKDINSLPDENVYDDNNFFEVIIIYNYNTSFLI